MAARGRSSGMTFSSRICAAAFAVGILAFDVRTPAIAGDARAERLVAQSRLAMGGDALARRHTLRLAAAVSAAGLQGTGRQWLEIGGSRFAESYITDPVSGGDGYDGRDVWNRDGSGLVWVDGGDAGRATTLASVYVENDRLYTPEHAGAAVMWAGTKSDRGVTYDALRIVPQGAKLPFELWFDRATHRPARSVQAVGPITAVSTYSDYHRVAGIMVPYRTQNETSDGNRNDATVDAVAVDPADAADHLRKPASSVHDFAIADGATETTIPFDLVENHVYLYVMLNGKGPYRFIYDTGGVNIVDPAVAQEIGAAGKGAVQGGGVGSATESLSFANVDAMTIGGATLTHQLFAVAPVRQGFGISSGRPVDGLIGFEVLARFVTTFDYAHHRVVLAMPGNVTPPAGADVIPFVLDSRQPQFPCTIDSIATQCSLDTGARDSITLFSPFIAAHPEVVPATLASAGVNGYGFGGPALGRLGRLTSFGVGRFTVPQIVADLTTQSQGAFAAPFIAANVGGNLFRRFTLMLDYGKQTMALAPNAAFSEPDVYERAGLFLLNRSGKKVIADVRPGTPGDGAGLKKGDIITAIDGADAAGLSLEAVRARFTADAGTMLRLKITHADDSTAVVVVTLRDYI